MSKEIVVPGELLSTEPKQLGAHTFSREEKIYSEVLGLKNEVENRVSVVPLAGKYVPLENDVVIGVVSGEKFAGYDIEINSFYPSFVNKQDLRSPLKMGQVVSAKIMKVNEMNEVDLAMVRSLEDGEIISVTPVKVPRIIGKNASMLNAIKNGSGSSIMVGRNGLIWVHGGNENLAVETIRRVEEFAHAENLTSDIQHFLAAKTGTGIPGTHGPTNESLFDSGFDSRYGRSSYGPPRGRMGGGYARPRYPSRGQGFSRGPRPYGGGRPGFNRGRNNFGGSQSSPMGFRPNRRFGSNYESNPPSSSAPDFDRRKRTGRDSRVRGDEDPTFD